MTVFTSVHSKNISDVELRKKHWGKLVLLAMTSLFFGAQVNAADITKLSYSSLPGDKVQVSIELSGPASEPSSFTIDNPARIALDFLDTGLSVPSKSVNVGVGAAHSISAVEASGRTRVVLNLVESVPYEVSMSGNTVLVSLGAKTSIEDVSSVQPTSPASASYGGGSSINNIDFRRGPGGEGRILVDLSDPSVGVDIGQEGGKVIVDFLDTSLPAVLDRRLDVIDFATPVEEVDTAPFW